LGQQHGIRGAVKGIALVCNLDFMLTVHHIAHMLGATQDVWMVTGLKRKSSGYNVSQQQLGIGLCVADQSV